MLGSALTALENGGGVVVMNLDDGFGVDEVDGSELRDDGCGVTVALGNAFAVNIVRASAPEDARLVRREVLSL